MADRESGRSHSIPAAKYPAGFVFYKMGVYGFLRGLPDSEDISASWQLIMVDDEKRRNAFAEKHGRHALLTFHHVPDAFAKTIAKIAYCQVSSALDLGDLEPMILPYIMGERRNISYLVGNRDGEPELGFGYRLDEVGIHRRFSLAGAANIGRIAAARSVRAPTIVGGFFARSGSSREQTSMIRHSHVAPSGVLCG